METTPLNKAVVTIPDNPFWPTGEDFIHIGDDRYSLFYRVNVRTAEEEEEHLIVNQFPHSISQAECETVCRIFRETTARAIISFIIAEREGWAQVITAPGEEFNPFNLAAAIAVLKASWGWDESKPIVVMINGAEVRIWPRVHERQWAAEDREETGCEGLP
jgi:hypothetical protein